MAVAESTASPGTHSRSRSSVRKIQAQLDDHKDDVARYEKLDAEEADLVRKLGETQAKLAAVKAEVEPELATLKSVTGVASQPRQEQIKALESKLSLAEAPVTETQTKLAEVRSEKSALEPIYVKRDEIKSRLEKSLVAAKDAEKAKQKPASVPSASTPSAAAAEATPAASPASPVRDQDSDYFNRLTALGFSKEEIGRITVEDRRRLANREITPADYRASHPDAVVEREQVVDRTDTERSGPGLIGWVLIVAIVLIGAFLLWNLLSPTGNRPAPSPAVTAAPTSAVAVPPSVSNFQTNPVDRLTRRYLITTVNPTALRVIDINSDKVYVTDATGKEHNVTVTFPEPAGLSQTFSLKFELKDAAGGVVNFGPVDVTVLKDSMAAGGIKTVNEFVAFLKEPASVNYRDEYIGALRAIAPSFPGVAGLTRDNLAAFVEANKSHFSVGTLDKDVTGNFDFVLADGTIGQNRSTLAAGTPVLMFDGKMMASALCANAVVPPSTPTPTRTPTPGKGGFRVFKFLDNNGNGVFDAGDTSLGGISFQVTISGSTTTCVTQAPDGTGTCHREDLTPGTVVTIAEVLNLSVFQPTTPASVAITITAGNITPVIFGNRVVTTCCGPVFVPTPTPAPTPVPTPAPTKNPGNAPLGGGSPTPMPASQTPAPTYTPPPPTGSAPSMLLWTVNCGTGCLDVHWGLAGSVRAEIAYGPNGNSLTNRDSGSMAADGTWVYGIRNTPSGSVVVFTVWVWDASGNMSRSNGSATMP